MNLRNTDIGIRIRYIVIYLVSAFVFLAAVIIYTVMSKIGDVECKRDFLEEILRHDTAAVENIINESFNELRYVSDNIEKSGLREVSVSSLKKGSFDTVLLADSDGGLFLHTDEGGLARIAELETILEESKLAFYETETQKFAVFFKSFSTPVTDNGQTFAGCAAVRDMGVFDNILVNINSNGKTEVSVLDLNGNIIAGKYCSGENVFDVFKDGYTGWREVLIESNDSEAPIFLTVEHSGQDYYTYIMRIDGSDLYMTVSMRSDSFGPIKKGFMYGWIGVFVMLWALILCFVIFRYSKAAEREKKIQSLFLSKVSHELRTPLNVILGAGYLMRRNMYNEEKLSYYMDKADDSASHLKDIIADILDLCRIKLDSLVIDEKAVYLNDIILEVYGVTAAMAKKAGVELLIKKAISTPCIYGDNARIKQVLTILIGNFIKASKPGTTINLSVSQRLTGKDRVETAFCFSGMCRRLNSEFIESLIRHDKWHRDLGLGNDIDLEGTICGALIEKMNGRIFLEECGETEIEFTLKIPFNICDKSQYVYNWKCEGLKASEKKKILIAEDNELSREIVTEILNGVGFKTYTAANGLEAVEIFERSGQGELSAVLMDLHMPVMDGYEAAERIRNINRADAKSVAIIALTANVFENEVNAAIAAGMDYVLTKPVDVKKMMEILNEL